VQAEIGLVMCAAAAWVDEGLDACRSAPMQAASSRYSQHISRGTEIAAGRTCTTCSRFVAYLGCQTLEFAREKNNCCLMFARQYYLSWVLGSSYCLHAGVLRGSAGAVRHGAIRMSTKTLTARIAG